MKFQVEYFFCSPRLLRNVEEIGEIEKCIDNIKWVEEFSCEVKGRKYEHQTGYNRLLRLSLRN